MASGWSKDKRPSRTSYWDRHTLEKKKVAKILANKQRLPDRKDGTRGRLMTKPEALLWWQSHRKGRVPDKYIPLTIQYGNGQVP
jgi:hypothetical protein